MAVETSHTVGSLPGRPACDVCTEPGHETRAHHQYPQVDGLSRSIAKLTQSGIANRERGEFYLFHQLLLHAVPFWKHVRAGHNINFITLGVLLSHKHPFWHAWQARILTNCVSPKPSVSTQLFASLQVDYGALPWGDILCWNNTITATLYHSTFHFTYIKSRQSVASRLRSIYPCFPLSGP